MYLVRSKNRKRGRDVVVADRVAFRYDRNHRPTGRSFAGFREVEDAGVNKARLRVFLFKNRQRLDGTVEEIAMGNSYAFAETSAADVKKVVRVLREQEATVLAEHDARIADLEQQVRTAQRERQEFLQTAFSKGNVVPLKDAVASAEERK